MISGSWRSAAGKVPTAECGDTARATQRRLSHVRRAMTPMIVNILGRES